MEEKWERDAGTGIETDQDRRSEGWRETGRD